MPQRPIQITDVDSRRLQSLIEGSRATGHRDADTVERLECHLGEAEVVPADRIGPDLVTMNSRIEVTDLDRGETFAFVIVFPRHANAAEARVSVLAPLGMASLGRRLGEEFSWACPGGERRLKVSQVVYQPEREGKDVA
jgi:regulator of nucleoside diphosphate kinase